MIRYVPVTVGALRRAAVRGAVTAAAASALFLVGLLSPGATEGSGKFNVDGATIKLAIFYEGACGTVSSPLTLGADLLNSAGAGSPVYLNGDTSACLGIEVFPFTMLVGGSELIAMSNVYTAATTNAIDNSTQVFTLYVQDCQQFPDTGDDELYVEKELMTYNATTCNGPGDPPDTISITGRPGPRVTHDIGSFVRAKGKMKVVARGQPTYNDGDPSVVEGATPVATHLSGTTLRSPITYLSCRGRLKQTKTAVAAEHDPVTARSRCYARLEPPTNNYWPDFPKTPYLDPDMPVLPMPDVKHDTSKGTIDDQATSEFVKLELTTDFSGDQCAVFVQDWLWVKMTMSIMVDKDNSAQDPDQGQFQISLYTDKDCTSLAWVLGGTDNLVATTIDPNSDTDQDGCSDFEELGGDDTMGGLRDPYNRWDYFNPSGNQYPDLTTDILPVAFKYHLREQFQTEVDGQTAAGQDQMDVTVTVGHNMQAGDTITINQGGGTEETATIAAGGVDLTSFPTATLTLTANLANKHSDGEQVVRPRDLNVPMDPLPAQSYDPKYDRNGSFPDGNSWSLRPPVGYIDLTTAILKVAMQYHHDCRPSVP